MLKITIPSIEEWDSDKEEFIKSKDHVLQLEHSLVSLSKWEAKWHKPFLSKEEKTIDETKDYIKMMTITQNVNDNVYSNISKDIIAQVINYINEPMTATTFTKVSGKPDREIKTSELIYYLMIAMNIPFECQKWHLNRLLTLINVCNIKNAPPQKMDRSSLAKRNHELNAARRKQMNSGG